MVLSFEEVSNSKMAKFKVGFYLIGQKEISNLNEVAF